jgi:hypothetical protein
MTMTVEQLISKSGDRQLGIDGKLAAYLAAAGAVGSFLASEAQAVIVGSHASQSVGINGAAPIDFNSDGQIDFEIDHDRVDLGGGNVVDYLQLDKNDTNGASLGENPLPINVFDTFDLNSTPANNTADAKYVIPTATASDYPAALTLGTPIGPGSFLDFQEGDNFQASGKTIRANRLIDEDAGQVDQVLGGLTAAQIQVPTNGPNFLGLAGQTRYLGVQMNLNSAGPVTYGWIGIEITNEADATANVVGWAYETSGSPISAGVPEPSSIVTAAIGGVLLVGGLLTRKLFGGRRS